VVKQVCSKIARLLHKYSCLYQSWEKCCAKDWNLSYQCITSERARYTLQERLDEDLQFALSISQPHVDGFEEEEDDIVDGSIFEDDLAISADALIDGLAGNTSADKSQVTIPKAMS
jgi:hypothetical protein